MNTYSLEQKLELMADILDVDSKELHPDMKLSELEWDSVTALSYIAMMEEVFKKEVKGMQIKNFVTLQDAIDLMEN